jgi:hypothetical protein
VREAFSDFSGADLALLLLLWSAAFLLVFTHAQRHGSKHATAWGVAAFLAAGIVVPVYFVRHWLRRRQAHTDS